MTDPAPTIEDRARARAAALREQAERLRIQAERDIAALLTAAAELEALCAPPKDDHQEDETWQH